MSLSGGSLIAQHRPPTYSTEPIFDNDYLLSILGKDFAELCLCDNEKVVKESGSDTQNLPSSFEAADEKVVKKSASDTHNLPSSFEVVFEKVIKERASDTQNLSSSFETAPVVLKEKNIPERPNYYFSMYYIDEIIKSRCKLKETRDPAPSFFRIDPSDLDEKSDKLNANFKKHTNDVRALRDKSKAKTFKKSRHRKPRLFDTEEHYDDKVPYICLDCEKTFAFYKSLLEHGMSHVLN